MLFLLVGYGVGVLGTMVGVGGGFLVVPLLMLALDFPAAAAAGTAMTMVLMGAAVGSLAYARQGRVDYAGGLLFALASFPGAILGAKLTGMLGSRSFHILFGLLLGAVAIWMLLHPQAPDRPGTEHPRRRRLGLGVAVSLGVGFLASLLGIGGGIIHVPAMIYLLGYPAHVAAATSNFVLAWTALVGALIHFLEGHVRLGPGLALGAGAACGAPLGAALAARSHGRRLTAVLALALLLVAVRLVWP